MRWSRMYTLVSALVAAALLLAACGGTGAGESAGDDGADSSGDSTSGTDDAGQDGEETEAPDDTDGDDGGDGGGDAQATYTWNVASYQGPGAAFSVALEAWADHVTELTDGQVEFNVVHNSALLGPAEILNGVAQGRAQLGNMAPAYYPSELRIASVDQLVFITPDVYALMHSFDELYKTNDAFREDWASNGVHVILWFPVSTMTIGATEPITGLDWFRGKRIRTSGFAAEAIAAVGGSPVTIDAPEMYESFQRGVFDAYGSVTFDIAADYGLLDIATHVIEPGIGSWAMQALVINKELYDSLPADVVEAMEVAAEQYMQDYVALQESIDEKVCDEYLEKGGNVSVLSDEDKERWKELAGQPIIDRWIEERGDVGQQVYEQYIGLIEKYEAESDYVPGVTLCAERSG